VSHLLSRSNVSGPLTDGNARADNLVSGLPLGLPTQTAAPVEAAQLSHALYHQNASALHRQFHLTREQAQQIIKSCQQSVTCLPQHLRGFNPLGLQPRILWQMDVAHIPSFGHVSVDTYSGYIYASVHTGEATKHVITHCLAVFTAMGKPQ
jgi:hypothetical protein